MDNGQTFFSPIAFTQNLDELQRVAGFNINLEPIVPNTATGTLEATGRVLIAFDTVPETILLLGNGLAGLVGFRKKKLREK